MTTTNLIEALHADTRAKLAVLHTLRDLHEAVAVLTETINLTRTAPDDRSHAALGEDPERRLACDLLMLEAARADLVTRLDTHGRALEAGLFGLHHAADKI